MNKVCALCGQDEEQHKTLNHIFTLTEDLTQRSEPKPQRLTGGLDVVLRLAMIDKGLITAEDLALKEAELRDKLRSAAADPSQRGNLRGDQ